MKEVVITGASRGIGFETAVLFAHDPDTHVTAIARSYEGLKTLIGRCPEGAVNIIVSGIEELSLPETLSASISHIDILINNAGQMIKKTFSDFTEKDKQELFSANFFGHATLTASLLPLLSKGNHPHVINIGSMAGYPGSRRFSGLSYYGAAKAALASLTESLAAEYPDICFNCLAIGAVNTGMLQISFPGYSAPVSAAEMAAFIHHFALSGHHVINGKILPVNLSDP